MEMKIKMIRDIYNFIHGYGDGLGDKLRQVHGHGNGHGHGMSMDTDMIISWRCYEK